MAAVKWQSNNLNINIVAGVITERTLAGIRRDGRDRGRGQVDGLTRDGMHRVVSRAEAADTLAGLRDSAMIRLMSDCLLRISEVVAVNIEDVDTTLTIRSSKTDQEGKGESLFIGEPTLDAIEKYCKSGEIESGALFRRIRRGQHITSERLSVVSARRIIKKWAKAAGIEGFISGHSLRVGTAVSLAHSPERRSSICKLPVVGTTPKCPHTTQELNWQSAVGCGAVFLREMIKGLTGDVFSLHLCLPLFLSRAISELSTVSRREMRSPIWIPLIDYGAPDRKLTQNICTCHFSQISSTFMSGRMVALPSASVVHYFCTSIFRVAVNSPDVSV